MRRPDKRRGRHKSACLSPWALSIRKAHKESGLTAPEVARRAGVCLGTVVKVMQGSDRVLLAHIVSVARAVGIAVEMAARPEDGEASLMSGG